MQDLALVSETAGGGGHVAPTGRERRHHRASRHHHGGRAGHGDRHRSASSSRRPARLSGPDSSGGSSSGRNRMSSDCSSMSSASASSSVSCQKREQHVEKKLAGLFMATKIEMMRMVETDLKLKLDVREMKERFYALLKNFEAFEQQQPSVQISRQGHRERYSRHQLSQASQRRHLEASVGCPNNTKTSSCRWTASRGFSYNDTAELASHDYSHSRADVSDVPSDITNGVSRVDNISAITQCSNVTYREQSSQSRIMEAEGPLSSTMSYPQYSTPEKKKRPRAAPASPIAELPEEPADGKRNGGTPSTAFIRNRRSYGPPAATGSADLGERCGPSPCGGLVYKRDLNGSDSDATPVAVRAVTRRLTLGADESDCTPAADTPSTTVGAASGSSSSNQETPRSMSLHGVSSCARADADDISIEVVTPLPDTESLKNLDVRLRRQTAQPDLGDTQRSPVGLSETDLIDASSFFLDATGTDLQCSMNATHGASVANLSQLSVSPMSVAESVETVGSTDITSSTGAESSYKESDATNSSPPLSSLNRTHQRRQQEARDHRFFTRQVKTLGHCTSGTSTSSCGGSGPGGLVAPSNSPNATSDSTPNASAGSISRWESLTPRCQATRLGIRPSCIGSDVNLMSAIATPSLTTQRTASDPEVSLSGSARNRPMSHLAALRTVQPEQRHSGTSSGTSSCSSAEQSASSLPNTSKESCVSVTPTIGIAVTPGKTRSTKVRRSLSKRLKKIGKQLWRASSKSSKADTPTPSDRQQSA